VRAAPVSRRVEVTVQPGDNFWRLAENRLRELTGREPSDSEVAPYWVTVVEANRDRIRSGNPDLIYPGEVVLLPDLRG
jgi:nucleoid-associated protein YgaU